MPSNHYGMDNFLCTEGYHLKLNLINKGVELTGQNKLAVIGLAFTLEVVIIIAVLTGANYWQVERALSAIPLVTLPSMILPKLSHLTGINLYILSRLNTYQEEVYTSIANKIISETPATTPVVTLCTAAGDWSDRGMLGGPCMSLRMTSLPWDQSADGEWARPTCPAQCMMETDGYTSVMAFADEKSLSC